MNTPAGRLPNFLIIGAPKSGTTSLARYLSHHPDIFMARVEEPKYFAYPGTPPHFASPDAAMIRRDTCWQFAAYRQLFADWHTQKMGGEKSAQYLWAPGAPRAIHSTIPEARLMVILRHPVDRAYSHFTHNLRALREPLSDFALALEAEPARKRQQWSYNYLYLERGRYAEQLERYYALFPRSQMLVLLYDDLVADTAGVMRTICRYLGIAETCDLQTTERHNASIGVPQNHFLHRLLTRDSVMKSLGRVLMPVRMQRQLWWSLYRRNLQPLPRFDPHLRQRLVEKCAEDIERLARLIGRDLSAWLAV